MKLIFEGNDGQKLWLDEETLKFEAKNMAPNEVWDALGASPGFSSAVERSLAKERSAGLGLTI